MAYSKTVQTVDERDANCVSYTPRLLRDNFVSVNRVHRLIPGKYCFSVICEFYEITAHTLVTKNNNKKLHKTLHSYACVAEIRKIELTSFQFFENVMKRARPQWTFHIHFPLHGNSRFDENPFPRRTLAPASPPCRFIAVNPRPIPGRI